MIKKNTELIQYPIGKKDYSYVVPDSVTSINKSAFSNCSNLINVHLPDSVTSIGSFAFSNCLNLKSINISDNMTFIDSYAFINCSNLTNVNLPDDITTIGKSAFYNCSSLTNIHIPGNITTINNDTFSGCTGLTSINIPNSVTRIRFAAFENCALTDVYYTGTQKEWEAIDCNDQTIANLPPEAIHFSSPTLSCLSSVFSGGEDILYQPDNPQQNLQLDIVITNLSADETVDELSKTLDKTAQNVIVNITLPDGFSFAPDTDIRTKGYAFTSLADSGQISETVYLRNPPAGISSAKINVTCDNANTVTLFHNFSVRKQ